MDTLVFTVLKSLVSNGPLTLLPTPSVFSAVYKKRVIPPTILMTPDYTCESDTHGILWDNSKALGQLHVTLRWQSCIEESIQMRKIFWKIVKALTWLVMPLLGYGYAVTLFQLLADHRSLTHSLKLFVAGIAVGAVLWLLLGRFARFLHVFEHEATHVLVGLCFLSRPSYFVVSDKAGMVQMSKGNFITTLAPYWFPLFSYLALAFYPLLRVEFLSGWKVLVGLTIGYHFVSKIQDFRPSQRDIISEGLIFSFLFSLCCAIISFGVIISVVLEGGQSGLSFLKSGFHRISVDGMHLVAMLSQTVQSIL